MDPDILADVLEASDRGRRHDYNHRPEGMGAPLGENPMADMPEDIRDWMDTGEVKDSTSNRGRTRTGQDRWRLLEQKWGRPISIEEINELARRSSEYMRGKFAHPDTRVNESYKRHLLGDASQLDAWRQSYEGMYDVPPGASPIEKEGAFHRYLAEQEEERRRICDHG